MDILYMLMEKGLLQQWYPTSVIEDVWVFESWETLVYFLSSNMLKPDVDLLAEMVKTNRKTKLEEENKCSFVKLVKKLWGREKSQ